MSSGASKAAMASRQDQDDDYAFAVRFLAMDGSTVTTASSNSNTSSTSYSSYISNGDNPASVIAPVNDPGSYYGSKAKGNESVDAAAKERAAKGASLLEALLSAANSALFRRSDASLEGPHKLHFAGGEGVDGLCSNDGTTKGEDTSVPSLLSLLEPTPPMLEPTPPMLSRVGESKSEPLHCDFKDSAVNSNNTLESYNGSRNGSSSSPPVNLVSMIDLSHDIWASVQKHPPTASATRECILPTVAPFSESPDFTAKLSLINSNKADSESGLGSNSPPVAHPSSAVVPENVDPDSTAAAATLLPTGSMSPTLSSQQPISSSCILSYFKQLRQQIEKHEGYMSDEGSTTPAHSKTAMSDVSKGDLTFPHSFEVLGGSCAQNELRRCCSALAPLEFGVQESGETDKQLGRDFSQLLQVESRMPQPAWDFSAVPTTPKDGRAAVSKRGGGGDRTTSGYLPGSASGSQPLLLSNEQHHQRQHNAELSHLQTHSSNYADSSVTMSMSSSNELTKPVSRRGGLWPKEDSEDVDWAAVYADTSVGTPRTNLLLWQSAAAQNNTGMGAEPLKRVVDHATLSGLAEGLSAYTSSADTRQGAHKNKSFAADMFSPKVTGPVGDVVEGCSTSGEDFVKCCCCFEASAIGAGCPRCSGGGQVGGQDVSNSKIDIRSCDSGSESSSSTMCRRCNSSSSGGVCGCCSSNNSSGDEGFYMNSITNIEDDRSGLNNVGTQQPHRKSSLMNNATNRGLSRSVGRTQDTPIKNKQPHKQQQPSTPRFDQPGDDRKDCDVKVGNGNSVRPLGSSPLPQGFKQRQDSVNEENSHHGESGASNDCVGDEPDSMAIRRRKGLVSAIQVVWKVLQNALDEMRGLRRVIENMKSVIAFLVDKAEVANTELKATREALVLMTDSRRQLQEVLDATKWYLPEPIRLQLTYSGLVGSKADSKGSNEGEAVDKCSSSGKHARSGDLPENCGKYILTTPPPQPPSIRQTPQQNHNLQQQHQPHRSNSRAVMAASSGHFKCGDGCGAAQNVSKGMRGCSESPAGGGKKRQGQKVVARLQEANSSSEISYWPRQASIVGKKEKKKPHQPPPPNDAHSAVQLSQKDNLAHQAILPTQIPPPSTPVTNRDYGNLLWQKLNKVNNHGSNVEGKSSQWRTDDISESTDSFLLRTLSQQRQQHNQQQSRIATADGSSCSNLLSCNADSHGGSGQIESLPVVWRPTLPPPPPPMTFPPSSLKPHSKPSQHQLQQQRLSRPVAIFRHETCASQENRKALGVPDMSRDDAKSAIASLKEQRRLEGLCAGPSNASLYIGNDSTGQYIPRQQLQHPVSHQSSPCPVLNVTGPPTAARANEGASKYAHFPLLYKPRPPPPPGIDPSSCKAVLCPEEWINSRSCSRDLYKSQR